MKNRKKCLFVYNPHSGKGKIQEQLAGVIETFTENGYVVTAIPTQKSKESTKIIAENGQDYDLVVVSGGDGTLTEGISGITGIPMEQRPGFAYIPAGTTNDVARSLGISRNPNVAAQQIMEGHPHRMDVGRLDEIKFTYVAAFGAGTEVTYNTPQSMKKALGHSAYVLSTMKSFQNMKKIPVHVEMDDGTVLDEEVLFGMVSSSKSVGGFQGITGDDVSMDDGVFELLLVPTLAKSLQEDWENFRNMTEPAGDRFLFNVYKVRKVSFDFEEEIEWTIDGEYAGARTDVEIEALPGFVELIY